MSVHLRKPRLSERATILHGRVTIRGEEVNIRKDTKRLAELQQHLALYFTEFARTASEIAQEQLRLPTQKITNPTLNEIYKAGLSAGALGEKLLGAAVVSWPFSPHLSGGRTYARLKRLSVPFAFSTRGSHVVVYEPEHLYDQALANERNAIYGQDGGLQLASIVGKSPLIRVVLGEWGSLCKHRRRTGG